MVQVPSGIQNTSAALAAERTRLDVISENIANAYTTRCADGKPYQRRVVLFESAMQQALNSDQGAQTPSLRVARIEKDTRPPVEVYEPGNPDAGPDGMVSMPNINVHEEMADLISASRAFEANLVVVRNARAMAMQVLSIGKR